MILEPEEEHGTCHVPQPTFPPEGPLTHVGFRQQAVSDQPVLASCALFYAADYGSRRLMCPGLETKVMNVARMFRESST